MLRGVGQAGKNTRVPVEEAYSMKRIINARRNMGANLLLLLIIVGAIVGLYFLLKYLVTDVLNVNSIAQPDAESSPMRVALNAGYDFISNSLRSLLR